MDRRENDRHPMVLTWLVYTEASALATLAVMPYLLTLQGARIEETNAARISAGKKPVSPLAMAALSYLQSHITFGAAAGVGLVTSRTLGLPPTSVEAWLRGEPRALPGNVLVRSAARGVGAALAVGALDYTVFNDLRKVLQATVPPPAPWRGLLASLYGGIAEEVLMRLGVQTSLAAGLRRLLRERLPQSSSTPMWAAIGVSNLLFGLGHLPAVRGVLPLSPLFVARTLILNGVAGTIFGYLYWTEGLKSAMIAHGAADLTLHVAGAALAQRAVPAGA
jgi:hypothetical protein